MRLMAVPKHDPAGMSDTADEPGIARQRADYRLQKLFDKGRMIKKEVGNSLV